MEPKIDRKRYLANIQDEIDTVLLYRTFAELEQDERLAEVYRRLAEVEERHARFWEERLRHAGEPVPRLRPSWRARVLAWLARRFGPSFVLPTVTALEASDSRDYLRQPESRDTEMPAEERSHQRVLQAIVGRVPGGLEGSAVARLEGRHRAIGGNALRAAVLGANDGLVSNLSLVMGVAGAELSNQAILITGLAGLLAGAISMSLGEWLSVQSSRELYRHQIAIEAEELRMNPEEEELELTLIYEAKGLSEEEAKKLAHELVRNEDKALDTLAREELGIDPEELGGSAWEAAGMSFVLFAVGAIFPVAPFAFLSGTAAVAASLVLSAAALFGIGAAITLMTGRGVLFSGMRQMAFGLAAAAVTYGIGWVMGVSITG